jgi:glycosyltransferase involved in cell wall biosynthesis
MRIAYLARRPIPSVHAHAVQIVKMCEAFAQLGHEVVLFANLGDANPSSTFSRYGIAETFRIEVHPKKLRFLKKPRFISWLLRRPFIRGADLFFGRDIASLAAASFLGKPVIYEAHAIPPAGSTRSRLLGFLVGRRNFSHLVCVTSTLADLHRGRFPALASKPVIVVPNAASELPDSELDFAWPGRTGAVQVGLVGRPFPGKGIETMVDAAAALPDVDFHIVGAGRDDLSWIESPIPPNLHLHGYRGHGELGGFYRRFDIAAAPYGRKVLNASRVESATITSPLKLLEYMAAGLPSIVSEMPGVRDILGEDAGVAMLVPPGDDRAFIAAVKTLAGDPRLRSEMGAAARKRFRSRHTLLARATSVLAPLAAGSHSSSSSSATTSPPRVGR